MNTADITTIINSFINAGTLTLPGTAFGSATMQASFTTYLTNDELIIAAALVDTNDTEVIVTGSGQGRFNGLTVTATFTPAGTDVSVAVSGSAADNWILPDAFPNLAGGAYDTLYVTAGSTLVLLTIPPENAPSDLTFNGSVQVKGILNNVLDFLIGLEPIAFSGPISVTSGAPGFMMTASVAQGVTVGTLKLLDFNLNLISTAFAVEITNSDGTTSTVYAPSAAITLSAPISFSAKDQSLTVTTTMPFSNGPIANLSVTIDGDPGILLADFFEFAGGDLQLGMPPADLFDPSNYLTLDDLSFTIIPAKAELIAFSLVFSTVQDWVVIPNLITITDVTQTISSLSPTNLASITGYLEGTVQLGNDGSIASIDINAVVPNFTLSGELTPGTTVDLSALITYLIPSAIGIPSIILDYFQFSCQPAAENPTYSMAASLSTDWTLDLSPIQMSVTNAYMSLDYGPAGDGSGETTSATIGGTIVFNQDVSFTVNYNTPGDFIITGSIPEISLISSVARLANIPLTLPSGFDLTFAKCAVVIQYGSGDSSSSLEFQISATVENLGDIFFNALKVGTEWGYAAGLTLGSISLSEVPGLSALAPFDQYFQFKKLVLIVSTSNLPSATFNDQVALPSGQSIVTGLNAYADIDLSLQQDTDLLMKFLNVDAELAITLQVGLDDVDTGSALYASITSTVNSNIAIQGSFGAKLVGGILELFMTGDLTTDLQGQSITFFFTLAFEENGAFLSGGYDGTIDFVIVKLSNLIVEIGIDFEGIPTIGFGAQIDVTGFETSVMVLLDSVDPLQSMFVASVSDISLGTFLQYLCNVASVDTVPADIMGALNQTGISGTNAFSLSDPTDTLAQSLNNRDVAAVSAAFATAGISLPSDPLQVIISVSNENELWFVTDITAVLHYRLAKAGNGQAIAGTLEAQLYVVPQPTQLGTTLVAQGFRANATLDLFGFKSTIEIEIEDQQGFSIDVAFSKIIVTVDSYPIFSLTSADKSTGPSLSVSTFYDPDNTVPAKQAPHFYADGAINLLGVISDSVSVNFTESGGSFDISAAVLGFTSYSLTGNYDDTYSFSAKGTASVGLDYRYDFGSLGEVQVTCKVSYSYVIAVTSATSGTASAEATFDYGGVSFTIPSFPLPLNTDSLADLATYAIDQVKAAIQSYFALSTQWLNWVELGLIIGVDGAEAVGAALEAAYQLAYDDIATQTSEILAYSTDQVTQALQGAGASAEETYNVLVNTLGVSTAAASAAVASFFSGTTHTDVAHVDSSGAHVDTNNHVDTPNHVDDHLVHDDAHFDVPGFIGIPHSDSHTDSVPHDDTSLHDDTSTPHDDTSAHYDTPHADILI